jgi:hypothetical protein
VADREWVENGETYKEECGKKYQMMWTDQPPGETEPMWIEVK